MTIKDINPMDFAEFARRRLNGYRRNDIVCQAKEEEAKAFVHWAAMHIFPDHDENRKNFLRMAGVIRD